LRYGYLEHSLEDFLGSVASATSHLAVLASRPQG
jgi:hypothetical protein